MSHVRTVIKHTNPYTPKRNWEILSDGMNKNNQSHGLNGVKSIPSGTYHFFLVESKRAPNDFQ